MVSAIACVATAWAVQHKGYPTTTPQALAPDPTGDRSAWVREDPARMRHMAMAGVVSRIGLLFPEGDNATPRQFSFRNAAELPVTYVWIGQGNCKRGLDPSYVSRNMVHNGTLDQYG